MGDHEHLWVDDGNRIVCTHCQLDLEDPLNHLPQQTVTIEIVPESTCPTCGGGDEFFNRPKVGLDDGWWWRCYNPACTTGYYNPDTGAIETT